jgi:hypothetical protein
MQSFHTAQTLTLPLPIQKQHYYYHDYSLNQDILDFDEQEPPSFQFLSSPLTTEPSSLSSFSSESTFKSFARKGSGLSITRRASTPSVFMTSSKTRQGCECTALNVKRISHALLTNYPVQFLKYGVYLKIQSHETMLKTTWISSVLPASWKGYTKYSFTCSLLLPDIGLYENDQPCSFQITKRYSEFRAFYLDLVYSSHT